MLHALWQMEDVVARWSCEGPGWPHMCRMRDRAGGDAGEAVRQVATPTGRAALSGGFVSHLNSLASPVQSISHIARMGVHLAILLAWCYIVAPATVARARPLAWAARPALAAGSGGLGLGWRS
jgi:hypothetical protein